MMKLKLWKNNLDNWIKVNWIKLDSDVCSAMGLNKKKYSGNSSLKLLIPWAIASSYDAFIDFIGHYLKRDRYKYQEWGWKKNDANLYLESSWTSKTVLLAKLTAKSSIVDIRPGSKYPTDERNKIFTFSIKATLKATTLDVRMCSTELLLSKNQKGSAHYPMALCKRNSTADIFLWIFKNFLDKLFHKTTPNHWF